MFIGQDHILRELDLLLPELKAGGRENLIFRGSSGYGKTDLGLKCCVYIGSLQCEYLLPIGNTVTLNSKYRVHFIDECHEIKEPEFLYPMLDSGVVGDKQNNIFIFATNEVAELKEPLVNRCIQFYFRNYTEEELYLIANQHLKMNPDILMVVVRNCNGNPRILIQLCRRIVRVLAAGIIVNSPERMRDILSEILDVTDGLTELHIRYLDFLRRATRASLDTMSAAIHVDKATIKREIEPILIGKEMIKISSKGRQING